MKEHVSIFHDPSYLNPSLSTDPLRPTAKSNRPALLLEESFSPYRQVSLSKTI